MSTNGSGEVKSGGQGGQIDEKSAARSGSTTPVAHYWSNGRYTFVGDFDEIVPLHHLAAIANGADPHDVWGNDDIEIHHQTHRELNLPSTIVTLSTDFHRELEHSRGLWFKGEDGIPRLKDVGKRGDLLLPDEWPNPSAEAEP